MTQQRNLTMEEIQKTMFRFIAESEARTHRKLQDLEKRCWSFTTKVYVAYTLSVFIIELLIFSVMGYHHVVH